MPRSSPEELLRLLDSSPDSPGREEGWAGFLRRFSPLLLHAVRWGHADHDSVMDRYAFVLERLREDDAGRLRTFKPEGRAEFGTWLVVVARRLSLDWERHRVGRPRSDSPDRLREREARQRLQALLGEQIELAGIEDERATAPDAGLLRHETRSALDGALAALPDRDRLLVRLRFVDGASVRDIARLMDFPSQFHVHRRLNQVLAHLKAALKRRGVVSLE